MTSVSQSQDQVWVEARVVASLDVWIATLRPRVLLAELFSVHHAEILNQNIVFEEYVSCQSLEKSKIRGWVKFVRSFAVKFPKFVLGILLCINF